MISIDEARSCILARTWVSAPVSLSLVDAVGLVLAEPAVSDIDSPPYDKALMDGYAVRAGEAPGCGAEWEVVERIMAGQVPTQPLRQRICSGILPIWTTGVIPLTG